MALNLSVTDTKAEIEGTWVPFPLVPSIKVKIARFMNAAHEKALKDLRKPYASYGKTLTEEQEREIFIKSLAEAVLLDWSGVMEGDKEVPYSTEEAIKVLSDPEARDFREFVVVTANDLNTFRRERIETAGKP